MLSPKLSEVFGSPVTLLLAAATPPGLIVYVIDSLRDILNRRSFAQAQLLQVGWQVGGDETGAEVSNKSRNEVKDVVLTVNCVRKEHHDKRQDMGDLLPDRHVLLSTEEIHAGTKVDAPHMASRHIVEASFSDGKHYWYRDGGHADRIRFLRIWAERNRAETLARYFGRRSNFRKTYAVKVEVHPFGTIQEVQQAFEGLVRGDPPLRGAPVPDIIVGPHDWIGRVVLEDSVIEPSMADTPHAPIEPKAINALRWRDRQYAVPYVFDTVALIRNDALAAESEPGPMPETVEDLLRQAHEMVPDDGPDNSIPLALQVGAGGDPYHMWPLFSSAGGSFFGLGRDHSGFARPDEWMPGFVDAFVALSRLGEGEDGTGVLRSTVGRDTALELFLSGRAPFLQCSSRALRRIHDDGMKVTVGNPPRLGDHRAVPMVSVYGFFIYEHAPNLPAARDLLVSYLQNPQSGRDLQDYQKLVPVQSQVMTELASSDRLLAPYIENVRTGMLMPSDPMVRDAWKLLGETERKVLAGDPDPRALAREVAERGWDMLTQARRDGRY